MENGTITPAVAPVLAASPASEMLEPLTPRQREIQLTFLQLTRTKGYPPTLQEVGDKLGVSKVTVFEHVRAMERKGWLHRIRRYRARSVEPRVHNGSGNPSTVEFVLEVARQLAAAVHKHRRARRRGEYVGFPTRKVRELVRAVDFLNRG